MNGKRTIYTKVKAAIQADNFFKTFDIFFDQIAREERGEVNTFVRPACFIEFEATEWE